MEETINETINEEKSNKIKTQQSSVEVFKVKGNSMENAFHRLKIEEKLDNYSMQPVNSEFGENAINNGKILKHSKYLHRRYLNNEISEYTVFGTLYNKKPIIKDDSKVVVHNIVSKGTKKWETINSYRFDSGEAIYEDTETKANALEKAKELAVEYNKTINIVISKRLVDMDGILGIAEFIPFDNIDDDNIYIFWVYKVNTEESTEEEEFNDATGVDTSGQYYIKEDLFSYYSRKKILQDG